MSKLAAFQAATALRTLVCDAVPGCPVTMQELSLARRAAAIKQVQASPDTGDAYLVRACSIDPVFPEDFDFDQVRGDYMAALVQAALRVNGLAGEKGKG